MAPLKVLGVSGSLRRDSWNSKLLGNAEGLLADAELVVFAGLKDVPPYDEDDDREPAPVAVQELRSAFADADAILFATPEYNSSVPGQLKNALDWASRPLTTNVLRNKPVAVVGASTGMFGAVWAQAELKKVLAATGARVQDSDLPVSQAPTRFDETGLLIDEDLRARLAEILEELLVVARPRVGSLA